MKIKKWLRYIGNILLVAAVITVTLYMCFYMYKLRNAENMAEFEDKIRAIGFFGAPVMLVIQIMQVVLAIIPGEPLELAMGALYGTLGGFLLCMAGIAAGTSLVFLIVRKQGRRFVDRFVSGKTFSRLKFLKDPSKRDVLLFLLMFIPGTPKDTLTYFAPFSGVTLLRFLVISLIARIPSVISSTYIGANIMEGNYMTGVIAFLAVGAVSLAGIIIYNKLIAMKNVDNKVDTDDKIY